jgi:hypothetical protein
MGAGHASGGCRDPRGNGGATGTPGTGRATGTGTAGTGRATGSGTARSRRATGSGTAGCACATGPTDFSRTIGSAGIAATGGAATLLAGLLVQHSSQEERDADLATGMESGMQISYDRLQDLVREAA